MKALEELLSKIDAYYVGKSKKEILYSYIMAGGLFAFISWAFLFDYTKKVYDDAQKQRSHILKNMKVDKRYLHNYPTDEVDYLESETKTLRDEFKGIKENSDYIDYKISQLEPLIYNETAWGTFLDSISAIAKKQNVNINYINNKFAKKSKEFGHVLDLDIGFSGDFKPALSFINALEQTPLVVDIYDLNIRAGEEALDVTLKLAVWGISY